MKRIDIHRKTGGNYGPKTMLKAIEKAGLTWESQKEYNAEEASKIEAELEKLPKDGKRILARK